MSFTVLTPGLLRGHARVTLGEHSDYDADLHLECSSEFHLVLPVGK